MGAAIEGLLILFLFPGLGTVHVTGRSCTSKTKEVFEIEMIYFEQTNVSAYMRGWDCHIAVCWPSRPLPTEFVKICADQDLFCGRPSPSRAL